MSGDILKAVHGLHIYRNQDTVNRKTVWNICGLGINVGLLVSRVISVLHCMTLWCVIFLKFTIKGLNHFIGKLYNVDVDSNNGVVRYHAFGVPEKNTNK